MQDIERPELTCEYFHVICESNWPLLRENSQFLRGKPQCGGLVARENCVFFSNSAAQFSKLFRKTPHFSARDISRGRSWTVSTPEEYERLTPGGVPGWSLTINPGAHPNVLGETKRWANSYSENVVLNDKYGNYVSLDSKAQRVTAHFTNGANLLSYLPTDYTQYSVRIGANVTITADDIRVIEQWKAAKALAFGDESDFAAKLVEHSALLEGNQQMGQLTLSVERRSFEELTIGPLFVHLTGLGRLRLTVSGNSGLVEADLRAFAARQNVPDDFEVKFFGGSSTITYTKRSQY